MYATPRVASTSGRDKRVLRLAERLGGRGHTESRKKCVVRAVTNPAGPASPQEPFKGQKRPPCTRYVEVELIGACWGPHELKAPCPDVLYEHQGKCYVPLFSAKPPPSALEP